jgi:hypothetical protein
LPIEEWEEWPDWLILKKYSGIQKVKCEEINSLSDTVSQIAAMVNIYLMAQSKEKSQSQPPKPSDFLPFRFKENKKYFLDQETAQILLEAMKAGQVPVFATQIIVDCGLYDEIIQLVGEKS